MADSCCHFAWGPVGAVDLVTRAGCSLVAIVDVLSFSTTVSVATSRGISIIPAAPEDATSLAHRLGVPLAAASRAGTPESPWTLAPSRMMTAPVVPALVLPSPNGSAITAAVASESASTSAAAPALPVALVAACLRNRAAVAHWLAATSEALGNGRIAVVAAGERWPDGSLRPASEDLVGAACLLGALAELGLDLSPEAELAARTVKGTTVAGLSDLVCQSLSAAELRDRGFADDVGIAAEVDVTDGTPVLDGVGAYVEQARAV